MIERDLLILKRDLHYEMLEIAMLKNIFMFIVIRVYYVLFFLSEEYEHREVSCGILPALLFLINSWRKDEMQIVQVFVENVDYYQVLPQHDYSILRNVCNLRVLINLRMYFIWHVEKTKW